MTLPCCIKFPYILLKGVHILTLLVGLLVSTQAVCDPLKITITSDGLVDDRESPSDFFQRLLILSLEKTRSTDGDYLLAHLVHRGGIARDRAMLIAGAGIDVMWATVTKEREQQMLVVPVDLLKSLNNYRVLLINGDSQAEFDQVKTLSDLRKYTVGSGEHWTDGSIMKDNGFPVMVTSSYSGLFKMLAARRFHFIPRGLHEIGYDTKEYESLGLVQERRLVLQYDIPIQYSFFVNKNNIKLADRIERGLKIAQQDGSFDTLFYQVSSFKEGEEILRSSHRTLIKIKNTKR